MTTFTSEDREMASKHDGIESPHNACCYKYQCLQQQVQLSQFKALSEFESKTLEDCNTVIANQQAEIEALREANNGFARHLIANPEDNKPVGNMCLGCGSSWSDERLEIERRLKPNLISCCPDRKVVPVYANPLKFQEDALWVEAYEKGFNAGKSHVLEKNHVCHTDDGDAFRLAVKLKIEVYHGNDEGDAVYAGYYTPENTVMKYCIEYYDDITHMGDACSATRRAIVRAATEIGKTNPLRKASEK